MTCWSSLVFQVRNLGPAAPMTLQAAESRLNQSNPPCSAATWMHWIVLVSSVSASSPVHSLMMLQRLRSGAAEDFFGTGCFIQGAVRNQHKLPGLERRLALHYLLFI
jgi:hypothetical protein